jgi:hypothetical protein
MRRCLAVLLFVALACHRKEVTVVQHRPGPARTGTAVVPFDARNVKENVKVPLQQLDYLDRAALGAGTDANGAVLVSRDTFAPGEPVRLSMWVHERPAELHMAAEWTDAHGKLLAREEQPLRSAKAVTFTLDPKLVKPGEYHVTGFWGGNVACEYKFKVEAKKR